MSKLLPGEHILWEGRPDWRSLARNVTRAGWAAGYFAALLVWNGLQDRMNGAGPMEAVASAMPLLVSGLVVVAACLGLAYVMARTTRYTLTTERCILRYGVALSGTLSIPLRRLASVSVAANTKAGAAGDIPMKLKPGSGLRYMKLWPHARPGRYSRPEPMLRGVPNAVGLAAMLSHAAMNVNPGKLHAMPRAEPGRVADNAILAPGD